ncbi:MAG: ABC transporter ATP-binding protein [Candidatus Eremiobacteraeota bacterium]|nr:ABC transporter ATP-binding protein [Candidatus Eremiobacteraeota bacterium]
MDCANVVDVRHLAKTYGEVTALHDLTVRVASGEIFGFLGQNGAGKTTAIKLLLGLTRRTSGNGTVMDRPLGAIEARRHIGYLPELFRYQPWLSAREVLVSHAALLGIRGASVRRRIDELLETVGLAQAADRRVGTFSKGMQQRTGLAVAMLGEPKLIFLDEPTSALDPNGRADVRQILRELKSRGTSVFLNSHLLSEVEQVCDRVAIVRSGRVVAEGTLAEILGSARAVRVRATANGTPLSDVLGRFGRVVATTNGSLVVNGAGEEQTPAIVGALVAANASVYEVEPLTATLEERFLEMTR